MLQFEARLGAEYCDKACLAEIYLRNRVSVSNRAISLHEAWTENKLTITHYHIWGCPAYLYIPKEKRAKLNHRSWKGIFVGYHIDSVRIYRTWDPVNKFIRLATSVRFYESWDIKLASLRQFEQTEENSNVTEPNDLSDNEDEDLLLPDHIQPLDEVVNESDTSLLTKLNDNNIEQLVSTEESPMLSPPILRQSTRQGKEKRTTGP